MNYKCEICAVTFDSSHVCNKIVDLMESPESNDRTKSRLDLPKTSSHEGKKPFKCEICDISFGQKAALKKHLKNSHTDDKDIVRQEAAEFKEQPTGIDEDYT